MAKVSSAPDTIMDEPEDESTPGQNSTHFSTKGHPETLEGLLNFRMGKDTRESRIWKRRYVVLDLHQEGSLKIHAEESISEDSSQVEHSAVKRRSSRLAKSPTEFEIPSSVDYVVKDGGKKGRQGKRALYQLCDFEELRGDFVVGKTGVKRGKRND